MPPRKRKEAVQPVEVVESSVESYQLIETAEAVTAPEAAKSKPNLRFLSKYVWNTRLEDMQNAVRGVEGDDGTMSAVASVLKSKNSGEASQYLQQIIQRNS